MKNWKGYYYDGVLPCGKEDGGPAWKAEACCLMTGCIHCKNWDKAEPVYVEPSMEKSVAIWAKNQSQEDIDKMAKAVTTAVKGLAVMIEEIQATEGQKDAKVPMPVIHQAFVEDGNLPQ